MTEVPLHAALVHLPLGLAMVLPVFAIALVWSLVREWLPRQAWLLMALLQLLLVAGAMASLNTGEAEEERVEHDIAHEALETHETRAKVFLGIGIATLVFSLAVAFVKTPGVARTFALLATLSSIAGLVAGVRVGHSGGELVYVHGAPEARKAVASTEGSAEGGAASEEDSDGEGGASAGQPDGE